MCLRGKGGGAEVMAEARRRSRRGRVSGARRIAAVLRSSRTAMSDDGWTRPPGSGQDGGVRRPADETDATPFPDVSPAARQHPPRQQNCRRRTTAAEAQQQSHRSRKAYAEDASQRKEGARATATKSPQQSLLSRSAAARPQPQQSHRHNTADTAAGPRRQNKMRGRSCMGGLSDLCRKLSGGMGLVLVLLLSGVISEELGLNVTRNRLIVSELHLEGSSA